MTLFFEDVGKKLAPAILKIKVGRGNQTLEKQ
jgi:hypothetical protein